MAHKTADKRFHDAHTECFKAWEWLRKIPEYKNDYKTLSATKRVSKQAKAAAIQKWGFFPLYNPRITAPPFGFLCYFVEDFNPSPLHSSHVALIKPDGFDTFPFDRPFDLIKTFGPLPEEVTFKINWSASVGLIISEIQEYIDQIKKIYKVKEHRTRETGLATLFQIHVLKRLNKDEKYIRRAIKVKHVLSSWEQGHKESHRKQASRAVKKYADKFLKT